MRWRTKLLAPLAAVTPVLLAVPPAHPATQTVALWHMDSAPMIDSSGNGHDGILTDVAVVPGGVSGNAYAFEQPNSSVTVPDSRSLNPGTSDFSFTVHVNFTAVPNAATVGDYDLIRKGLSGTSGGEWKLEIVPNGTAAANAFCMFKDDAGHSESLRGTQNLADGTWHSLTCGRTSTTVHLVVDGSSASSRPGTALGNISSNAAVVIGQKWRGGDQYAGLLDEVSFDLGAPGSGDGDDDDDTTAPTLASATPAGNATGVGPETNVTATFSETVQNVGSSTFVLAPSDGGDVVAAEYSANTDGTEWTLNPTADLARNTWYTGTLNGISDTAGNALASSPVTWRFRTGSASPASSEGPAASATGASPTAKVAVLWMIGIVLLVGAGLAVVAAIRRAGGGRHSY